MEDYFLIIQKNIKRLRKEQHLTQEQLANMLNGKKSLVSNYENGYSVPDIFVCIKLSDIFRITIDELVGHELEF